MKLNLKLILLFFVVFGMFASPAFAQQFREPNYEIIGAEVTDFKIDQKTKSLIISIEAKSNGGFTITIPRNLIDAKDQKNNDTPFIISISGLEYNFYEEIITPIDRTVSIPFSKYDTEIIITGTQMFNQVSTIPSQSQGEIDRKIAIELKSEIPDGKAKLLIFSNTKWSGALQASGFDYAEISNQNDRSIIFACEPSLIREGIFVAKFQKTTDDGYLRIVAIQDGEIIDQGSTNTKLGQVNINGPCVISAGSGGGGCLIATATYGSELAPQVQQLREIRDKMYQTQTGGDAMHQINDFYYTFSPTISDWERENPMFKEAVKLTITPLLTSLSILNYFEIDSDVEMIGIGMSVLFLNLGMYFAAPAIVIIKLKKKLSEISSSD